MLLEASWLLLQVPERCSVSTGGGGNGFCCPPTSPGSFSAAPFPAVVISAARFAQLKITVFIAFS